MTDDSTFQFQLAMWPMQIEQRVELNDDFDVPRPVEHFAYFRRRASANKAASELEAQGFAAVTGRRGLKTILQATRDEPLGDASVARFLREVIEIIERCGGEYDGWGATVESGA